MRGGRGVCVGKMSGGEGKKNEEKEWGQGEEKRGRGQFEERGVKRGLSVYVKERRVVLRKPR